MMDFSSLLSEAGLMYSNRKINMLPLKKGPVAKGNDPFLWRKPIFRGYVGFRECSRKSYELKSVL